MRRDDARLLDVCVGCCARAASTAHAAATVERLHEACAASALRIAPCR